MPKINILNRVQRTDDMYICLDNPEKFGWFVQVETDESEPDKYISIIYEPMHPFARRVKLSKIPVGSLITIPAGKCGNHRTIHCSLGSFGSTSWLSIIADSFAEENTKLKEKLENKGLQLQIQRDIADLESIGHSEKLAKQTKEMLEIVKPTNNKTDRIGEEEEYD